MAITLRERALHYLARREYSCAELRCKLIKAARSPLLNPPYPPLTKGGGEAGGFKEDGSNELQYELHEKAVDALLDDLTEGGYLSDARATTQLLHARRSRFGAQRIVHELHHNGISEELINDALPELKETELETARSVWLKKFGALPQDAKEKARQARFLQSRGFGFEVIFQVLRPSASGEDETSQGS